MAYLRPAGFIRRVFNPLAMRFHIAGSATLTVPGRRTGGARSVRLIPVEMDGTRYLVSARGETEWVRNLRAAEGGMLVTKKASERFRATEIPAAERPEIISAYRKRAGRSVSSYFTKLPDPADHPVFKVEPLGS